MFEGFYLNFYLVALVFSGCLSDSFPTEALDQEINNLSFVSSVSLKNHLSFPPIELLSFQL